MTKVIKSIFAREESEEGGERAGKRPILGNMKSMRLQRKGAIKDGPLALAIGRKRILNGRNPKEGGAQGSKGGRRSSPGRILTFRKENLRREGSG